MIALSNFGQVGSQKLNVLIVSELSLLLLFCSNAFSQDNSADKQEYDTIIRDAVTEYKLGNWDEA